MDESSLRLQIAVRGVSGEKVLLRCKTLFGVAEQMNANAIGAVLGEAVEIALAREWRVQIVGFPDEDVLMAGTAHVSLVVE